jgi:hypothetical protein
MKITKQDCFEKVAEYIVNCENEEYESYVTYCQENDLNVNHIRGKEQSKHVYALALIALELEFPN